MDQDTGYESGSFYRLLGLMQRLLQTPDGQGLYRQIEKGSRACEDMTARLEHRFLAYLDAELASYLQGEDPEPATRMVIQTGASNPLQAWSRIWLRCWSRLRT